MKLTRFDSTKLACALAIALGLPACADDSGGADDGETETEGTAGDAADDTASSTGDDDDDDDDDSTGGTGDDDDDDDVETTGDDDDDDDDDETTGGPDPIGLCVGLDQVGNLAYDLIPDGAEPGEPSCDPEPAPCGGDPVGTWSVRSTCGYEDTPNPLAQECPGSTFTLEIFEQSGTIELLDDGTYVSNVQTTSQALLVFDAEGCFGLTCEEIEPIFQEEDPEVTCVAGDVMCGCTFPSDELDDSEGTWAVEEDELLIDDGVDEESFAFCVDEDGFRLWQPIVEFTVTETECDDASDCDAELGDEHELYVCAEPDDEEE